jgi:hypothetical protein
VVVLEVIKQMRKLTENGIPFSVEYVSYNESGSSNGLVAVNKAILRPNRKSSSTTLIAYTNLDKDEPRFMHLPLITKFNGKVINNGY